MDADHSDALALVGFACSAPSCDRAVPQQCVQQMAPESGTPGYAVQILDLPTELLEKIFMFVGYEQTGKLRRSCVRFNDIGSTLLNSAFQRLQTVMLQRFQHIKSQMPRRESARRNHPLARECDIVETIHMRLTLLQMSFGKHIERKHCCFFAGEILDEVNRIFRHIKSTTNLGRAYKVTDELFDLTTMAMEYFKEYIEPELPEITYFSTDFLEYNNFPSTSTKSCTWKTTSPSSSPCNSTSPGPTDESQDPTPNNIIINKKIKRLRQGMKRNNSRVIAMKRELKSNKNQIADQQKQLIEYGTRLEDNDKKFEEYSRKFGDMLQELNKCKTELQYWRSKSPANQVCCSCQAARVKDDGAKEEVAAAVALPAVGAAASAFVPTGGGIVPPTDSYDFMPISIKEDKLNQHAAGVSFTADAPCHSRCPCVTAAELQVTPDNDDVRQQHRSGDQDGNDVVAQMPLLLKRRAVGRYGTGDSDDDDEVPSKRGKSVVKCLSYK